ncbi:hypothetical protein Hdeb2414_s0012g00394221 [Helianthus debilis subsp. tardiflorus]
MGLRSVVNGLNMQQGPKLPFLKVCAYQTCPGGPPEFCLILTRAAWPLQLQKLCFLAKLGLSNTPKGNSLSPSLGLRSL